MNYTIKLNTVKVIVFSPTLTYQRTTRNNLLYIFLKIANVAKNQIYNQNQSPGPNKQDSLLYSTK